MESLVGDQYQNYRSWGRSTPTNQRSNHPSSNHPRSNHLSHPVHRMFRPRSFRYTWVYYPCWPFRSCGGQSHRLPRCMADFATRWGISLALWRHHKNDARSLQFWQPLICNTKLRGGRWGFLNLQSPQDRQSLLTAAKIKSDVRMTHPKSAFWGRNACTNRLVRGSSLYLKAFV